MNKISSKKTRLHEIAHARAGDKGNRSNISLIPYNSEAYPLLLEQVTEEKVLELFLKKGATKVTRYELPNLPALNFVIDDALEGGVNSALNIDQHGKSLSYLLLTMPIEAPVYLIIKDNA
ncbi:MAG: hypothetical protein CMM58_14030 [Rhodospirillaceae bacterium]|nr:hypothetical protein [Rhodospirillaceae bacterium]|tara:strand:- start:1246 stop:1605 length:360 start_codon:yes stop_codon:yes gene_type:complete